MQSKQMLMKAIVVLVLLISMVACDNGEIPAKKGTDRRIMSFLRDIGYSEQSITLTDSLAILANDGFMRKSDIHRRIDLQNLPLETGRSKHFTTNLVAADVSSIYITLDSDLKSGWADALAKAVEKWNAVTGTSVYFKYSKDVMWRTTDIYIEWNPDESLFNDAVASFPVIKYTSLYSYTTVAGPNIYVAEQNPNLSFDFKTAILMHELGHCLGFRHSNYWIIGESAYPEGAVLVPGTSFYDLGGVFATGPTVPQFSPADIQAIQTLWPGN